MSSHFPDHTFLCSTKVAIMKDKRFIDFGSPQEVVTEENLKNIYAGCPKSDGKIAWEMSGLNAHIARHG